MHIYFSLHVQSCPVVYLPQPDVEALFDASVDLAPGLMSYSFLFPEHS